MQIWDLDNKAQNPNEVKHFMEKHGFDKGTHERFAVGDVIEFNTGYNDDIRARAKIKGINGNDIYVYNDCYWFPIQDDERRKISKNPFYQSRRHTVRVEFDNRETITTEINGAPDDIAKYYIGTSFNLGGANGVDNLAVGAKIWFNDGCGAWLQHHRTFLLLSKTAHGRIIDHGDKIGLEVYSALHNGSKYYIDERRKQLLQTVRNWPEFIQKEFN